MQEMQRENLLLREEYTARYGFPRIVGEHAAIREISQQIQKVSATDSTVLLLGESGTGKELFARAVHHLSPRREQPFVALNCAAIPEGLVENELFGHELWGVPARRAREKWASWIWRIVARCFWMKLANCRWPFRRNFCACWKTWQVRPC